MNVDQEIRAHYDIADLEQRVLRAVAQAGKDIDALTVEDLSLVDEFLISAEGRARMISCPRSASNPVPVFSTSAAASVARRGMSPSGSPVM